MSKQVNITLRPYDALAIMCFMREYINDSNRDWPELKAIHETVDAYEKQINEKVSIDMVEDARLECRVNDISGRHPKKQ